MSAEWSNTLVDDAVQRHCITARRALSQRDRPLLLPARFVPSSSVPTSSARPPSKWSPVSSDWTRNKLHSEPNKIGSNF